MQGTLGKIIMIIITKTIIIINNLLSSTHIFLLKMLLIKSFPKMSIVYFESASLHKPQKNNKFIII